MTAYNREAYIATAIESVLASSFQHFELIIVDDGSGDRTVDIARNYASTDTRVQVYVNEQNLGDYPNRNKAASYATGKYIKYVDADDYIYPWGLELLVLMMEKFPEAGWGLCSLEQFVEKPFPFLLSPRSAYAYHYMGPGLFHKAPLSSIIKKDVFELVNGFSQIRMAGDFEIWHRLAQKFPVVLMPHGIVWYRKHSDQEMSSYSKYIHVYERIKLNYLSDSNCPLEPSEVKEIIRDSKRAIRINILKGILTFHKSSVTDNFKKLKEYRNAG
jgi:glycosyltransferase involved in cell wall biosynthesis